MSGPSVTGPAYGGPGRGTSPAVRRILGCPVLLLPVGLLLLVVGGFVALNGVGDYRTGEAVEGRVMCAASESDVCFDVVEATISAQVVGRRDIGREWDATAVDGDELKAFSVTDDDSELLDDAGDATVGIWVKLSDPTDPAAVELPDGTIVESQWNGWRGVAAHLAFGLLAIGVGFGLVVTALRFARSGSGWWRANTETSFGSAWAALVIVPAAIAVFGVLVELPPAAVLVLDALGLVGLAVAVVGAALVRR